jgi:hypothetical protein
MTINYQLSATAYSYCDNSFIPTSNPQTGWPSIASYPLWQFFHPYVQPPIWMTINCQLSATAYSYYDNLLSLRLTPELDDHQLSAIPNCLFILWQHVIPTYNPQTGWPSIVSYPRLLIHIVTIFSSLRPTPKLYDHQLSAIPNCLFILWQFFHPYFQPQTGWPSIVSYPRLLIHILTIFSSLRSPPKLDDHQLSAIRNCLFILWQLVIPTSNPQTVWPPIVSYPRLLIHTLRPASHICKLLPAMSNRRTVHAVMILAPLWK